MTRGRARTRGVLLSVMAVALVIACVAATGCSTADPEPSTSDDGVLGVEETVATHPPLPESEREIGLTDLGDGRIRAVGIIQYRASEGASWCIVNGTPGEEPPMDAEVIVVIENMADLDAACSTSGALVYAEGVMPEDDGTLPGPPMTAEFVARADGP
ncbi:MAG TPA: hypothetical protein DCP20_03290 [Coriobacteriia bacterium]|nr:MAG: hypothetical protein XD74_0867 [Actinobacteria bacterium 66_15]HAL29726.1 hypothetical protein [Coriobacteriia bacterium]